MQPIDYFVLLVYGAGILLVGSMLSKKNKTTEDMFAVKKQSPWWLSGLSSFMSAFSAGTFVVWGGIAYKSGLVAVSILMCSGISSFIVGRFIATKWASLGIVTVGEYLLIRFGRGSVQFYTWIGMLFKIIAMGVALYSFAVLVSSLIHLSPGHWLADPATGNLSIPTAVVISGALMLVYAVSGGLWAVLIIDAIQFVVLTATVMFVVPLCLSKVGGISGFLAHAPEGFLAPTGGAFTWLFLLGWVIVHTFKLGGEWVFIQRFLAVSSPANARKASYLFGTLYLISPIIWMLPPMLYRLIDPAALPEKAYILACASVLPAGMIGLLLAAMFSSAASYIDGEVNVYAGAITNDVYKSFINPQASEKKLVMIGRVSSFLIGGLIISIALMVPYFGGAEQVILTITGLLVVAMVLPVLWGLYFGKIRQNAVWISTGASMIAAIFCKYFIPKTSASPAVIYYNQHRQEMEVMIGLMVPVVCLLILELSSRTISKGFLQVKSETLLNAKRESAKSDATIAYFPARLLGFSIGALSLLMFGILIFSDSSVRGLIALFAGSLLTISLIIIRTVKKPVQIPEKHLTLKNA
ncbi:sodium:solute symporter family transporter [Desertivirga xinjiangensis]|uniref:sodium:solute symporter family transporter n=1 Tax=Desertivirga xinjiangensis TaxID=539206 RepID=UPI00210F0BDE|nr:hypothetical protein [Pedobacter xinjiangensis]